MNHYILVDKVVMETSSTEEWAENWEKFRRILSTKTLNGSRVSTVFLGIDHNFSGTGDPILFETMVFGDAYDEDCERYATWDDAIKGHWEMVLKHGGSPIKVDLPDELFIV